MSRSIHYCKCGEEIFDIETQCAKCDAQVSMIAATINGTVYLSADFILSTLPPCPPDACGCAMCEAVRVINREIKQQNQNQNGQRKIN